MSSKTKQIGCSGEFAVIKRLLDLGCEVFRDVTDSCNADLVIRFKHRLYTVQVKTLSTTKAGSVGVRLWKRQRGKGDIPYDGTEFDILALHVLDRNVTLFVRLNELLAMGSKAYVSFRFDGVTRCDQRSYSNFESLERCFELDSHVQLPLSNC